MTISNKLQQLQDQYVITVVDLDAWHDQPIYQRNIWLKKQLMAVYKTEYQQNERVVFTLTRGDVYDSDLAGRLIIDLHQLLNTVDISNFFVILLVNDAKFIPEACKWAQQNISTDSVPITTIVYADEITERNIPMQIESEYSYSYLGPNNITLENLPQRQQDLLTKSSTFCILPWIHLHAQPGGQVYPCCRSNTTYPIGNCQTTTLKEIWNGFPIRDIRQRMLTNNSVNACSTCYEQESAGADSNRRRANAHHGHQIYRVEETQTDGALDRFEMTYWDIRFSNLCNLKCRSCGHVFSSQWYQDQVQLAGPKWRERNTVLNYAGRTETDMWEQLEPHLDYVDTIYFAGGEPLLMEEHYQILDELVRRKRFDVRLIYSTNFTHTTLKGRSVFEYWNKFKSVKVGASLDALGHPAEYIRKGTKWYDVVKNRHDMIRTCPNVDFYISSTLSILNAWHLPEFHKEWTSAGLICAQDLNVSILQNPEYYRIDIAPEKYKQQLEARYRKHLDWMSDRDPLGRATQGFKSAIAFMNATDNTQFIDTFWRKTHELDSIRNENILDVLPELQALK